MTAGLGSCVVFFYRGLRMRNRRWCLIGAVALTMTVVTFTLMPEGDIETINGSRVLYNLVIMLLLINWAGSTIVALALNPRWLRFLVETSPAVPAEVRASYRQPQRQSVQEPLLGQQQNQQWWTPTDTSATSHTQAPVNPPAPSPHRGVPQADTAAPTSPGSAARPFGAQFARHLSLPDEPVTSIEVNHARPAQLQDLGLGPADINSILAARERIGSFNSFEELLESSGVAPHVLLPLRSRLEFSANPTRSNRRGSRTLDL